MTTSRRRMLSGLGLSLPLVLTLAGCAAAPTRVPRLLRLEAEPRPEPGGATDLSAAPVWHLQRVQLPAYLDRELVLVMPSGRYSARSDRLAQSRPVALATAWAAAVMPKFV